MKRFFLSWMAIATLATLPLAIDTPASARFLPSDNLITQRQARPELKLNLRAEKQVITTESGRKQTSWQALKDGATVNPGDVLRYSLSGRNEGMAPARNLVLNQPIPRQMTYVLGSVQAPSGTKVSFSIDGGRTYSEKPMVKVKQADGKVVEQPAPAEAYTHVRWVLGSEVAAKAMVNVSYEVRVR